MSRLRRLQVGIVAGVFFHVERLCSRALWNDSCWCLEGRCIHKRGWTKSRSRRRGTTEIASLPKMGPLQLAALWEVRQVLAGLMSEPKITARASTIEDRGLGILFSG